jgi:hypothetical protein
MSRAIEPNERAAHTYAESGWPVLPLVPGEKVPTIKRGLDDATTDHRQIDRWWGRNPERNIGVATGRPGPDVLDVDISDGKPGHATLTTAIRAGLVPPPVATVRTRSGGSHLYYVGTDQRSGVMEKHGLDMRAAGGYVVAPPSSVGGKPYVVTSHGGQPATIDYGKIREHFEPTLQRGPSTPARQGQNLDHLVRRIAELPDGHGRNANYKAWWSMTKAYEAGDEATVERIVAAAIERGLSPRAVRASQRSAQNAAAKSVGRQLSPKVRQREAG